MGYINNALAFLFAISRNIAMGRGGGGGGGGCDCELPSPPPPPPPLCVNPWPVKGCKDLKSGVKDLNSGVKGLPWILAAQPLLV